MDLIMAGSKAVLGVDAQLVEEILADDSRRGEFVILQVDKNTFLQASGEGDGPYVLEYKDGGQQFQALDAPTKDKVKEAFLDYLRGGSEWKTERQWRQLAARRGCSQAAAVLVLLIGVIATILVQ
jgi:hypothetical protein